MRGGTVKKNPKVRVCGPMTEASQKPKAGRVQPMVGDFDIERKNEYDEKPKRKEG